MEADKEPIHMQKFDTVQERSLLNTKAHPYHQHTWSFQLISGIAGDDDENAYFRTGDWQDVYLNTEGEAGADGAMVMRFQPRKYTGKMMVHCHRLPHEDKGMMALEYVHGGECVCDSLHTDFVDVEIVGNDYLDWNVTDGCRDGCRD